MIVDVGDSKPFDWNLRDGQGNPVTPVSVTASLIGESGTQVLAVRNPEAGLYRVVPLFTVPGDWTVQFVSAGPDQVEEIGVYAVPTGQQAVWSPSLRQVAAHIPSRTRQVLAAGDRMNEPAGTFNDFTYPTGDVVQELVHSAVAIVTATVGTPVALPARAACETAAALWTAYWVELGWPERDAGVRVYEQLRKDADALLERATAVNLGAGGGTDIIADDDGVPDAMPSWSFPEAPAWADRLL